MCQQAATIAFWEGRWAEYDERLRRLPSLRRTWVSDVTRRFVSPSDGLIVEGGCGMGQHVAALTAIGYRCVGVDYAGATLASVKSVAPHLDLAVNDVRTLALADGCAAGYWSLGVIEHFWGGYTPILEEAARSLQPGGYLFLAFPALSPFRRSLIDFGRYAPWPGGDEPEDSYQVLLNPDAVTESANRLGFVLIHRQWTGGLVGAMYDLPVVGGWLRKIERYRGESHLMRGGRALLDRLLTPVFRHTVVLIFRRVPVG